MSNHHKRTHTQFTIHLYGTCAKCLLCLNDGRTTRPYTHSHFNRLGSTTPYHPLCDCVSWPHQSLLFGKCQPNIAHIIPHVVFFGGRFMYFIVFPLPIRWRRVKLNWLCEHREFYSVYIVIVVGDCAPIECGCRANDVIHTRRFNCELIGYICADVWLSERARTHEWYDGVCVGVFMQVFAPFTLETLDNNRRPGVLFAHTHTQKSARIVWTYTRCGGVDVCSLSG